VQVYLVTTKGAPHTEVNIAGRTAMPGPLAVEIGHSSRNTVFHSGCTHHMLMALRRFTISGVQYFSSISLPIVLTFCIIIREKILPVASEVEVKILPLQQLTIFYMLVGRTNITFPWHWPLKFQIYVANLCEQIAFLSQNVVLLKPDSSVGLEEVGTEGFLFQ
jgi:hypothetical protein